MKPSFWKKVDENNNILALLIKQDDIFMSYIEIKDNVDKFFLQEITHFEFVNITKDTNCLKLEETPIPLFSSH